MKQILFSIMTIYFLIPNLNAQKDNTSSKGEVKAGYQIGDTIEDFALPNTEGKMISLSNYKDAKGYIIVFTSNVCPFAVASEQRLIQAHKDMAPQGYPVIAINSNVGEEENISSMKNRVTELGIPFEYLKDEASVYQKFGARKTPHVFLVDNNMILQYMGSLDDNPRSQEDVKEVYLANAVKSLTENRTPDPVVTKSIGCPIKRGGDTESKGRKGPPNPQELLERMDENGDNEISKSEAKGPLANEFDKLDTNKDGQLSADELSKTKPPKRKNNR